MTGPAVTSSNVDQMLLGRPGHTRALVGPFASVATLGSDFAASSNYGTLAAVGNAPPYTVYVSTGVAWVPIGNLTSLQSNVGSAGVANFAADGTLVDLNGQALAATAVDQRGLRAPAMGIWWNFDSTKAQNPLSDHSSHLILANSGPLVINGQQSVTFTNATPTVVTDTAHGLSSNAPVIFNGTSAPTGINFGQTYYALVLTANTYNLATAPNGAAIAASSTGSAITVTRAPNPALPMLQFDGTHAAQSDAANMLIQQRAIFNTNTLNASDMILVWMDITHGTSLGGTFTTFFWGRTALEGYGLQLFGGAGLVKTKLYWQPPSGAGAGTGSISLDSNFSLCGDLGLNTRSVVALSIQRMSSPLADPGNSGQGGGLFEIQMAKASLTAQGQFGQHDFQVWQVPCLPGGVAASPRFASDTALTIGARVTSSATTFTEQMPATATGLSGPTGINFFGAQRRARQAGMVCQVVRQYAALYKQQQQSGLASPFVQPPCVAI